MKCKRSNIGRSRVLLSRLLFVLYLAAIAFLCLIHPQRLPEVSRFVLGIPTDKVAHFLMFLPFPVLAYLSFDKDTPKFWHSLVFILVVLAAGFGVAALTEYLQSLTPYRTADRADLMADTMALAVSSVTVFIIDRVGR